VVNGDLLFVRQPARVVIACRGEQCVLLADADERSNEIAVLERGALDEHAAGFLAPQLEGIERRGGAGLVIDLLLEPSVLLRHRLELPIQLESSLRQSIAYQLNRLTPFGEADLYFDVVVRERDAANRKLQVELVAAPRSRVEPLLREMTRLCGREIDRLTTADLGPAANLLGGSRARFRPNRNFWLLLALLGCLAVLTVTPLLGKRSAMLEQKAAIRALQQSVGELAREKNRLEARIPQPQLLRVEQPHERKAAAAMGRPASGPSTAGASATTSAAAAAPAGSDRARPKSRTLTPPAPVSITLPGFRSRCTTPAACVTTSTSAICCAMVMRAAAPRPAPIASWRVFPSISSNTSQSVSAPST